MASDAGGTPSREEMTSFVEGWCLDNECLYALEGQTLDVQRRVLDQFHPKPGTRDIRSLFYGFIRSVAGGGGGRGEGRGGGGMRGRGGPPSRRSDYRVLVSGLPPTGSWQDLKDHMREAGDVCYADVYKDGTGVVEFLRYEDMKYSARKLDDSKFRSHEGEVAYIRVKEDYGGRGGSRSRSRSFSPPRRSRASPSYSPMRRSRSRSPY